MIRPRVVPVALLAAALAPGCRPDTPAAPVAAPAVLIPPLHDAEPGEELRMRRGNEEWTWKVTSVTDSDVGVEFVVRRDGEPARPAESIRWSRNAFGVPPEFTVREIRRDHIEVGGRGWDCWLLRAHARSGVRYYWVTDELPAHGVLRMAVDERGRPALATAAEAVPEACLGAGAR